MFLKNTRRSPTTNQQRFFCSRADLQFPTGMEQCATFIGESIGIVELQQTLPWLIVILFEPGHLMAFFGGAKIKIDHAHFRKGNPFTKGEKWPCDTNGIFIFPILPFSFLTILSSHCMPSQEAKSSTAPHTHTKLAANQPMAIVGCNMLVYIYKYKYIYIYSHLGVLKFRNEYASILLIQFFFNLLRLESIFLGKADPISSF